MIKVLSDSMMIATRLSPVEMPLKPVEPKRRRWLPRMGRIFAAK